MKVVIIGSGSQGTGLAGLLAMEQSVESILMADYDKRTLETTEKLLVTLGDRRVVKDIRYAQVNAGNEDEVRKCIHGYDIVFNATIPVFNLPVMQAALKEKLHYLDLFASPMESEGVSKKETIGAQFELHEAFAAAGLTAFPSVGVTPGWTSLAAQEGIDMMDEVDSVVIRFADFVDTQELYFPVSPHVIMHEWLGAPHPLKMTNGTPEPVELLDSEEEFDFLQPLGKRKVYTVTAHPDIFLISRFAGKPIKHIEEKFGIFIGKDDTKNMLIKALQKATSQQGEKTEEMNILQKLSSVFVPPIEFDNLLQKGLIKNSVASYTTEVTGKMNGQTVQHTCFYTTSLDIARKYLPWASPAVYATVAGLPVELVLALGRGEIIQRGVLSVAQLEDIPALNRKIANRGNILTERLIRPTGLKV